jgi:hypothetical protein
MHVREHLLCVHVCGRINNIQIYALLAETRNTIKFTTTPESIPITDE